MKLNIRLKWWKNYTFSMNAVFATYAYELDENGRPYVGTRTEYSKGRFGRFQGMSQNISYTLTPDKLKKLFTREEKKSKDEEDEDNDTGVESNIDPMLEKGKNGAWWIVILLIFGWGGFGGNGWGGNGYGNGYTDAAIQRGFDNQAVVSKLDGINNGICSLGYDQLAQMNGINTNILQTGFGIQQAINADTVSGMQNTNAIQSTLTNMAAQNASCCCETQRQIERGFADTNYNIATQACRQPFLLRLSSCGQCF